jgi:outer membrane protein assembly factor BamB
MGQFLSQHFAIYSGRPGRSGDPSILGAISAVPPRNLCLTLCLVCIVLLSTSFAQPPIPTSRADNARDGANTNETLLTPANVNKNNFGRLFRFPVDYVVMAQPLYMPNVNIPGQGVHNVVYVVTQKDSVYAIDADNGTQLWYASMLDGGTTASGKFLPCGTGPGYNQEGIIGTPAIDTTTNTMYLVAKTVLNSTVRHQIHALDITTGLDRPGSPVLISAQSTSLKGNVTVFNSLHQKNRPGLLLLNGTLYMAFGSNSCNDNNTGWVLAYDAASLSQTGVFNTSPDYGLTSIWQSGVGIAGDDEGNIFAETAEAGSHGFDVPSGGQTYCNSVIKLSPGNLELTDFFTPWSVAFLNSNDLDLSSSGVLILPDQVNGLYPHELVAVGKQGFVYVLNRDNMGMFAANDSQIIQEFPLVTGETVGTDKAVQFGSPAYWNNTVYFAPKANPIQAYPLLSNGQLGTPLQSVQSYNGSHSPSISANGNTNGIVWVITGQLFAFDAVSLNVLYNTTQNPGRDKLPPIGHFVTQTVANGHVYVATQTSLEAYGLFHSIAVAAGGAQSATAATALPVPVQIHVGSPYGGQPDPGVTVSFSDGCKKVGGPLCGVFNPTSAVTDANGDASFTYTVPKTAGTYTLTVSSTGFASATTSATSTPGAAVRIIAFGGAKQTGAAGSILPKPVIAQAQDAFKNGVVGVTVNFTATKNGIPNPASAITSTNGLASTTLQLPTTVTTLNVNATSGTFKKISFAESSVAGPAATIAVTSGNNQSATAGTQLPLALTILVADQYGNPVSGNNVTFSDSGAGGTFSSPNPVVTGTNGMASQFYKLPITPNTITITASATGVPAPAVFTETGQ